MNKTEIDFKKSLGYKFKFLHDNTLPADYESDMFKMTVSYKGQAFEFYISDELLYFNQEKFYTLAGETVIKHIKEILRRVPA